MHHVVLESLPHEDVSQVPRRSDWSQLTIGPMWSHGLVRNGPGSEKQEKHLLIISNLLNQFDYVFVLGWRGGTDRRNSEVVVLCPFNMDQNK